jgi:PIN domain nuclease of toxin-antitoxin system
MTSASPGSGWSAACVLDASAVLALVRDERGGAEVAERLDGAVMSAVSWSEVVALARADLRPLREGLATAGLLILPFGVEDAEAAGALVQRTRPHGLGLGDRACLALAQRLGVPALTADRAWADLEIGVVVELIR